MVYQSFLVINPYGIGDVLFSTPLIRNLRENFPKAKIFFLCSERAFPVLKSNPLIDKIFIYNRDAFEAIRKRSKREWIKEWVSFLLSIRREKIEVALDLSLVTSFGAMALFAGIPVRIGLDFKKRCWFLNHKLPISGYDKKHVIEYQLDLLRSLGIPCEKKGTEVYPDRDSTLFAARFLEEQSIKGRPLIGIAPCGGEAFGQDAKRKRWPSEKFAQVLDQIHEWYDMPTFIFAGKNEEKEARAISGLLKQPKKCVFITGFSLAQVIALIDAIDLFISNDTGLLRIANAFNKKIIALFGPVDINVYSMYPFDPSKHVILTHDVECRPCYRRFRLAECKKNLACIRDIAVEEVLQAVKYLLPNRA